jgi:hypothetical protein
MLVFDFNEQITNESKIKDFKNELNTAIQNEIGLNLSIGEDIYSVDQTLVTIYGLNSKLSAEGLAEKLIKNAIIDESFTYFVISQKNYKIAQVNKNLDEYLAKYK